MNDADRRAIELATLGLPLTQQTARALGECTALGQAALLLAMDDSALEAWYLAAAPPVGSISRVLSRAVDLDEVADRIDASLATDPDVLNDLCRAQITWAHPELVSLLTQPRFRLCAAWMLSQTDFEPLLDWLDGEREPAELVAVARAVAPSGVPELFEALSPWLAAVKTAAPKLAAQLEAAMFILDPAAWGRGFVQGQWEAEFLHDGVGMADIIAAAQQSYWTAALAAFDPSTDEFGAIARMVAAGAAAGLFFGADDPPQAVVDAFYVEDWEKLRIHPGFSVAAALAEDDGWQQPLLEAAAHDVLIARGIDSPGIGGLPLSSSHPDADEVAAARGLPSHPQVDPIVLAATASDVIELRTVPEFADLPRAFAALREHPNSAVARLAAQLETPRSLSDVHELARAEDVNGLSAAENLARRGDSAALLALVDLWAEGPVLRASHYTGLILQELRVLSLEPPKMEK